MSKWIEKRTRPVLPLYLAALTWPVASLIRSAAREALLPRPLQSSHSRYVASDGTTFNCGICSLTYSITVVLFSLI